MNEYEMIEILKEINKGIKELNKSINFLGRSKVKDSLEKNLKNDVDKLIYYHSNGENGIRDIISILESYNLHTSYGGIHGRWQRWSQEGILEQIPVRAGKRYVKKFDIEGYGLKIPENIKIQ